MLCALRVCQRRAAVYGRRARRQCATSSSSSGGGGGALAQTAAVPATGDDGHLPPVRNARPPAEQRGVTQVGHAALPDEMHHADFTSGYAARLADYEEQRATIGCMQSVAEKIDAVNPYERDWTKAERRVWRLNHTPLYAPRGAWRLRASPLGYDSLPYYQLVTKTARVDVGAAGGNVDGETRRWADMYSRYYADVRLDEAARHAIVDRMRHLVQQEVQLWRAGGQSKHRLASARLRSRRRLSTAIVQHLLHAIYTTCGGTHAHLAQSRLHTDARLSTFWTRAGFQPLYGGDYTMTVGERERIGGDNLRLDGDLAFCFSETAPAIVQCREPLPPVDESGSVPPPPSAGLAAQAGGSHTWPYPPALWHPEQYELELHAGPLYQMCGHDPATVGAPMDPCRHGHTAIVDVSPLASDRWRLDAGAQWNDSAVHGESMMAAGIAAAFAMCMVEAHAIGVTQYDSLPRPVTSQSIVTNGRSWLFAAYQLNTVNLSHDWQEIDALARHHSEMRPDGTSPTPPPSSTGRRCNVAWLDGPHRLFELDAAGGMRSFDAGPLLRAAGAVLKPTAAGGADAAAAL